MGVFVLVLIGVDFLKGLFFGMIECVFRMMDFV